MVTDYPSDAALRGKPIAVIDHVSIAPDPRRGRRGPHDVDPPRRPDAIDAALRIVGTIARRRGAGDAP